MRTPRFGFWRDTFSLSKLLLRNSHYWDPKKVQNSGVTKHFCAYIKENYMDKDKGHLNHQELYSIIIKEFSAKLWLSV
jgi:hypothetical protein